MMQKKHIEEILTVNGIKPTSPEEVIRSVLLSARYNKDEVDAAIMVLRENTTTKETHVDGLHKVFRSDDVLSPEEISRLLGVDVELDESRSLATRKREPSFIQYLILVLIACCIAAAGVVWAMQMHQVGPFHPTASANGLSR